MVAAINVFRHQSSLPLAIQFFWHDSSLHQLFLDSRWAAARPPWSLLSMYSDTNPVCHQLFRSMLDGRWAAASPPCSRPSWARCIAWGARSGCLAAWPTRRRCVWRLLRRALAAAGHVGPWHAEGVCTAVTGSVACAARAQGAVVECFVSPQGLRSARLLGQTTTVRSSLLTGRGYLNHLPPLLGALSPSLTVSMHTQIHTHTHSHSLTLSYTSTHTHARTRTHECIHTRMHARTPHHLPPRLRTRGSRTPRCTTTCSWDGHTWRRTTSRC